MVEYQDQALDQVFHALADPTRRAMVRRLASGERTVTELAQPFAMSLAAASKHLKVLEGAGLVQRAVRGRVHRCSLDPRPLAQAQTWLRTYTDFWNDRLDVLDDLLSALPENRAADERD
ncbi:ArsR/SmtB family transcription factor [Methylobacterium sp. J-068]|uniref:ArsR/SmtB family transcription factor n=1 Tax=Methylobacterium sp. J-068 TaxID=2836649 RepID=UPI001FBAFBA1|nr:metalloregulator ArsR/SmtB family transcription factor [Methylobacterium sp. J-068]MCJ2033414.1 metalloregulator ArsR/SmtB family transcription factor [Methylobacterium sp. J-068]